MIFGEASLIASLKASEKKLISDAKTGMNKSTGEIQAKSVKDTPRDSGDLRKRSYTSKAEFDGKDVIGNVGYESPESKFTRDGYAIYVHEMTGNKHDIGKAKFLEDVVKKSGDMFLKTLQQEMRF